MSERSLEAWHALADAAGLQHLSDDQVAVLARAALALQRHVDRLPGELPGAAEPALIFRPLEQG